MLPATPPASPEPPLDGLGPERSRMLAALALCEEELDRRNVLPAGELAVRLARLRDLLARGRLPRIAVVGRRGAGKSSLLNAIAGRTLAAVGDVGDATCEARRFELDWTGRRVEWLDTPGLRAGGRPGRLEEVARALSCAPPDVLLFTCQASEVDAGIDDDLADLAAVLDACAAARPRPVALGAVVTKVDELSPPDVLAPPFDDPEKRANIRHAVSVLGAHLRRARLRPHFALPVNTYARFDAGDDLRWNVDALVTRVTVTLPSDAEIARRLLPAELRHALADAMLAITEVFADLAASAAARQGTAPDDLAALHAAHVRVLRALGPDRASAPGAAATLESMTRPAGPVEAARRGLALLGGRQAAAALAAMRLRMLGASLRRQLLDAVDDEGLARLFAPAAG